MVSEREKVVGGCYAMEILAMVWRMLEHMILSPSKAAQTSLLSPFYLCLCLSFSLCFYPPSSTSAQVGAGLPRFRQPPEVRIVGTFAALEDKPRGNHKTLTVHVKGKTWQLRLREIKSLTNTTKTGWSLLNDLFPPKLHFIGADDLLTPLTENAIVGKTVEIQGRLYVGDHQLFVSSVQVKEGD